MTTYETDKPRLQIPGLKIHEDRGDGTPLCNCWAPGKTFDKLPSGTVSCGLCARSTEYSEAGA